MSIQVNRSCSRYITSMATHRLRWTSSQISTVTLLTHVPTTDQPLVEDTTCAYTTTLQATAILTPTVASPTPAPLGPLNLVLTVDFMQDPTNSLPLMLKCFTRQQLTPCKGRSRLLIQAEYKYIFGRGSVDSQKESVLNGGFRFNEVRTNYFKINLEIDQEPVKIQKKSRKGLR